MKSSILTAALLLAIVSQSASAAAPKVGDKAPDFTLQGSDQEYA
jgi:hypothetical protein